MGVRAVGIELCELASWTDLDVLRFILQSKLVKMASKLVKIASKSKLFGRSDQLARLAIAIAKPIK